MGRRSLLSDAHADPIFSSVLDVRWVARLEGLATTMTQRVPFPHQNVPAPSITAFDSDDFGDEAPVDTSASSNVPEPPQKALEGAHATAAEPIGMAMQKTTSTPVAMAVQQDDEFADVADTFSQVAEVFTARERVPLASAWGIEDCSATLSSAFGALAETLQERPGDGDAALRLYEHNKTLLALVCFPLAVQSAPF